jgi:hypothetical protein
MALRLLQIFAAVNVLIALYNGGRYVVLGIDALPAAPGVDLDVQVGEPARALVDTWYRALGWTWLTLGLMLGWITRSLERHTAWFRLIFVGFMCVGVGRLSAVLAHGFSTENTALAIAIEIAIPTACIVWHSFATRNRA